MYKTFLFGAAAAHFQVSICSAALAQPVAFFQGFETDTAGWFDPGEVNQTASGTDSSPYGSGISAASGNFYARLGLGTVSTCQSASGPHPVTDGPFTRWGCYGCTFPTDGYKTEIKIYLDVGYAATVNDQRFDWTSAVNGADCQFRRDFVFNAGTCGPTQTYKCGTTGLSGFVISASNNATRCGAVPALGTNPVFITQSGWYRFEHVFNNVGGVLSVTFNLYDANGTLVASWTRSDPSDIIGVTVGGNRYGWFPNQEIANLAIDDSERLDGQVCGTFNCNFQISEKTGATCSASAVLPAPVPSSSPSPAATLDVSCTSGQALKDRHATLTTPDDLTVITGSQDSLEAILTIDGIDPETGDRSSSLQGNFIDDEFFLAAGSCTFTPLPFTLR